MTVSLHNLFGHQTNSTIPENTESLVLRYHLPLWNS